MASIVNGLAETVRNWPSKPGKVKWSLKIGQPINNTDWSELVVDSRELNGLRRVKGWTCDVSTSSPSHSTRSNDVQKCKKNELWAVHATGWFICGVGNYNSRGVRTNDGQVVLALQGDIMAQIIYNWALVVNRRARLSYGDQPSLNTTPRGATPPHTIYHDKRLSRPSSVNYDNIPVQYIELYILRCWVLYCTVDPLLPILLLRRWAVCSVAQRIKGHNAWRSYHRLS